ncbi:class I SAM-dependent methyltransferase [Nocardia thailandica]
MSADPMATAQVWDLVADGYARHAATVLAPFAEHALECASLPPGAEIADIGAGTGLLGLAAAERGARVRAIDISPAMVAELRARAAALGLDIVAEVADGQDLPLPDAAVDAAFSLFGLMFFPDRARGFAELRRVLRPGGLAVVTSWAPAAESSLMRALFGALAAGEPRAALPQPNLLNLENPEVFHSEMRAAGFGGVVIQRYTVEVAFPDAGSLWESLTASSAPLTLVRQQVGEWEWQRRTARALDHLEQAYRPNTPLSTTALFGIGAAPSP